MNPDLKPGLLSDNEAANCLAIGCPLIQKITIGFQCSPAFDAEIKIGRKEKSRRLSYLRSQIPENCTRNYFNKYIR